jgi:hypothetical protein
VQFQLSARCERRSVAPRIVERATQIASLTRTDAPKARSKVASAPKRMDGMQRDFGH